MPLVKGAPYKLKINVDNDETNLPADDELANDVDLRLYCDTSKVVAKYGNGNTLVEKPTDGEFIISISEEDTLKLKAGENGWLEGFILPCKKPIKVDLGMIEDNIAND